MKTALDGKSFLIGALVGAVIVLTLGTVAVLLIFPKGARGPPPSAANPNAVATAPATPKNALEGSWYNERNPINPCSIVSSHPGLFVTDENGGFSRLQYDPSGFVIATDWRRGLRGEVQEGKIYWANGVVWVRTVPEK